MMYICPPLVPTVNTHDTISVRYEEFLVSVPVYWKNYTDIISIPAFREENSLL